MPYLIDIADGQEKEGVTLADFVEKGIELLDGQAGFFMMVEGGKIDWACHLKDVGSSIMETIAMDSAVKVAHDFYLKHPEETLIVITADHETGGLKQVLSGKGAKPQSHVLLGQKMSEVKLVERLAALKNEKISFETVLPIVKDAMGLNNLSKAELKELAKAWPRNLGSSENPKRKVLCEPIVLTALDFIDRRAGFTFSTFDHTATPVITTAIGAGAQIFSGRYENSDIARKLKLLIMLAGQSKKNDSAVKKKDRDIFPALK